MIRKFMLSLLILIAATTAAHAEEQSFSDRKAHLTEIHALRVGYGSGTVRIVLDVAKPLEFTESYVENPSRMILDLKNAWLNSTVQKEIELKSLAAKKVRIAQACYLCSQLLLRATRRQTTTVNNDTADPAKTLNKDKYIFL